MLKATTKFISFVSSQPEATLREAADVTGVSYRQLQRIIGKLVEDGVVREAGVGFRGQKLYAYVGAKPVHDDSDVSRA